MEITLVAADGARLAADLVAPPSPRRVAVIAPALGVPRRFYAPLARFLSDGGIASITLDYRGIAGSRGAAARPTLIDFADLDLPAAVAALAARWPDLPRVWLGHSIGGQLFGLMHDVPVARAIFVAAQHGHWRNWPGWERWAMAALWWAGIPVVTRAVGRLPMGPVGGEDLPPFVAQQWASWGRDRDYVVGVARRRGGGAFARFTRPLRSYAISDDRYAPLSTVRPLAAAFRAAQVEVLEIAPGRVGRRRLGHFGAFRPGSEGLWEEWRDWLLRE